MLAEVGELAGRGVGSVGEVGVAVAELLGEVEGQPLGERHRPARSPRIDIRKALCHLRRRPQHRLAIPTPLALAPVERGAAADRDEHVLEQRAARCVRMDVSRGDRLHAETLGEVAEHRVAARVAALVRPLELDEEPLPAERGGEPRGGVRVVEREPVSGAAGEADEPVVQLGDGVERDGRRQGLSVLPPGTARAGMGRGEDPAEVRVPLAALAEQRDVHPAFEGDLGACDRPEADVLRGVRELERAVDAVVIGEGERRIAELHRPRDELLRMRGAVEEGVRRVAVELDVGATHYALSRWHRASSRPRRSPRGRT